MTIHGIGVDSTRISRVQQALGRTPSMKDRLFSEAELEAALARGEEGGKAWASYLASAFAIKEAAAKALGTGFRHFGWADMHTGRNRLGAPTLALGPKVYQALPSTPIGPIHVSLTSEGDMITAFCVIEHDTTQALPPAVARVEP